MSRRFNSYGGNPIESYGGTGSGKIFTVGRITGNKILWPDDGSNGVYAHVVKLTRKSRISNS
jgi:hypothetical protein